MKKVRNADSSPLLPPQGNFFAEENEGENIDLKEKKEKKMLEIKPKAAFFRKRS